MLQNSSKLSKNYSKLLSNLYELLSNSFELSVKSSELLENSYEMSTNFLELLANFKELFWKSPLICQQARQSFRRRNRFPLYLWIYMTKLNYISFFFSLLWNSMY